MRSRSIQRLRTCAGPRARERRESVSNARAEGRQLLWRLAGRCNIASYRDNTGATAPPPPRRRRRRLAHGARHTHRDDITHGAPRAHSTNAPFLTPSAAGAEIRARRQSPDDADAARLGLVGRELPRERARSPSESRRGGLELAFEPPPCLRPSGRRRRSAWLLQSRCRACTWIRAPSCSGSTPQRAPCRPQGDRPARNFSEPSCNSS